MTAKTHGYITKEIEYVSLTSTAKWWANCVSKYKKIKRRENRSGNRYGN